MSTLFDHAGQSPRLRALLARLETLVDWEKRDRSAGAGMRVDLAPVADLARRLGDPQSRLRCAHVTGTKGKGSTTAMIAAGLEAAGWATGAYFSPHVERVNERVRLRGAPIEDDALADALERAWSAREQALRAGSAAREASWFDLMTAAALSAFAEAGLDWAAVEVGIGGRLDSTNIVRGEVCVLTNVELEHTAVLGATRAAITREKAGILKPGSSVVTGLAPGCAPWSDEAGAVLEARAFALGCRILRPAGAAQSFEQHNRALAALALDELGRRGLELRASGPHAARAGQPVGGWLLDERALAAARLPARMELFQLRGRRVLLDGAHVPASLAAALQEARARFGFAGRGLAVLGMGRDKDAAGMLKLLAGQVDSVLCTTVGSGPYQSAELLAEQARALGLTAEVAVPPRRALARALELAPADGWILATGSLHLAGALRPALREESA